MTLADNLKQLKVGTKLSNRELAEEMGIDQYRLQKWINGTANPKYADTQVILKFFSVDAVDKISEKVLNNTIAKVDRKRKPVPELSNLVVTPSRPKEEKDTVNHESEKNFIEEQEGTYKLTDTDKYVQLLERTNKVLEKNNDVLISLTEKVVTALDKFNNNTSSGNIDAPASM